MHINEPPASYSIAKEGDPQRSSRPRRPATEKPGPGVEGKQTLVAGRRRPDPSTEIARLCPRIPKTDYYNGINLACLPNAHRYRRARRRSKIACRPGASGPRCWMTQELWAPPA